MQTRMKCSLAVLLMAAASLAAASPQTGTRDQSRLSDFRPGHPCNHDPKTRRDVSALTSVLPVGGTVFGSACAVFALFSMARYRVGLAHLIMKGVQHVSDR
jgi:hypothetical protein